MPKDARGMTVSEFVLSARCNFAFQTFIGRQKKDKRTHTGKKNEFSSKRDCDEGKNV